MEIIRWLILMLSILQIHYFLFLLWYNSGAETITTLLNSTHPSFKKLFKSKLRRNATFLFTLKGFRKHIGNPLENLLTCLKYQKHVGSFVEILRCFLIV